MENDIFDLLCLELPLGFPVRWYRRSNHSQTTSRR